MSSRLSVPSLMTVSEMLSFVTASGLNSSDGSFFLPLSVVAVMPVGFSPLASWVATLAVAGTYSLRLM